MYYQNMTLPNEFDTSILDALLPELLNLANEKAERHGGEATLCGLAECWEDCMTGFILDGMLKVILQFNVGADTLAVGKDIEL